MPTKTVYFIGETLDINGLTITAAYSDGSSRQITDYTTNPANNTVLNNAGITTVQVSYTESGVTRDTSFNITVTNHITLTGITVTNVPVKTVYSVGELLDLNGLVITVAYSDSSSRQVTTYTSNPISGAVLNNAGITTVQVSYTEGGATGNTSFNITVINTVTLTGITVTNMPTKTMYSVGETLDLSGLIITAAYNDSSSKPVTGFTINPANNTVLNNAGITTVQVNYTEDGVSRNVNFNITVAAASNTAGITLNVGQIIDGTPLPFGTIRISRTGINFPVTRTISVNPSDFDLGSIRWEVTGVGVFSSESVIGSGPSFTLDAAEIIYNSLGGHVLTLTVRKNGIQYQRIIPFIIEH